MTLQQLKYILAIDRCRSFAKAAEELGITQPTLSALLVKLEEELDARIFERTNKKVIPTAVGGQIIRQAERACRESDRIAELVAEYKGELAGPLLVSVAPSIAPYLLPEFIRHYTVACPQVELTVVEKKADEMMESLVQGQSDIGIGIGDYPYPGVLEIPLYTEPFWVYLSESCWRKLPVFQPENLEHEQMWIMKEAQCLRNSAFSFCKTHSKGRRIYEAGSIDTLVRIVDANGGFTIIPEMHLPFLTEQQRQNVRRIECDCLSQRKVSLYIKQDYVRQQMLRSVVQALLAFLPAGLVEKHLLKYEVKL